MRAPACRRQSSVVAKLVAGSLVALAAGLISFSTVVLSVTPATAGTPDPTLLPVATTSQFPLTAAYNALNVPSLTAGGAYLDPTTSVKVYRLTTATYPTSSPYWGHDYSEGGDEVSLPYNGNTRAVLVRQNSTSGGPWWLLDFTPGAGVSNPRQLSGSLSPWVDVAFAFSNNPATPYYAYVSNGSSIRRFDIRTLTEAPGNGWPITESSAMWLHQSENDGLFVYMLGTSGPTVVGYEPSTGTRKTYTNTNVNEPRIDRAGRYIGLCMNAPSNGLLVWDWQTNSTPWSTTGDPGIPFAHNASLRGRWVVVDWNLSFPDQFATFTPGTPASGVHVGGPAPSYEVHGNGSWIQHPADLNDQWALFLAYGGLQPTGSAWLAPGGMVLMTPNGQRRLLAHAYNTTGTYNYFSFAKFSSDGQYVLFTSDMNGSGRSDLFLVELPQTAGTTPAPTLSALSPSIATAGSTTLTLTATGANFVAGSVVQWNGSPRTTTFVSSTQLKAAISTTDLATAGTAAVTVASPGAGTSGALTFTITAASNPSPTLSSLVPTSATAGSAVLTLTATGTNFVAGSVVQWNGSPRTTTFVSSTQLKATISATDLATAGTASVAVFSPTPGGGTSGALTFTITAASNPSPTLSSLAPASATAGSAALTLTATGTNFVAGSVVQWNGGARTTTFVSSTQLKATISTTDLAAAGTPAVAVFSPTPGGGTSGALTFTMTAGTTTSPPPTITTALVGYWAFDEGSGTTAVDSSGNGNTGTLVNGPVWTTGTLSQALSFDGVSSYVNVPHTSALNAYPMTIAAWIKTSTTTGNQGIVNKYVAASSNGYQLFMNNGNLCAWYFRDASNYVYDGTACTLGVSGYADNQWHYVVFAVDGAGGRIHVDGVQKTTRAWTGTDGATSTAQPVRVGDYPGASGEYFSGVIDEVKIYSGALSATQVASFYGSIGRTAPVLSAIASSVAGPSQATITWTTNGASTTQVEYGPATAYGSVTALNTSLVTSHSQGLTGLAAGTVYHFRVKSADAAGNLATSGDSMFATAAATAKHKNSRNWFNDVGKFFQKLF